MGQLLSQLAGGQISELEVRLQGEFASHPAQPLVIAALKGLLSTALGDSINYENAGLEAALIVDKVMHGEGGFGYNARTGEYCDLIEAGIVDPTKVTRTALQNAASLASLLLTTEALITESPDKAEAPSMPHGGDF